MVDCGLRAGCDVRIVHELLLCAMSGLFMKCYCVCMCACVMSGLFTDCHCIRIVRELLLHMMSGLFMNCHCVLVIFRHTMYNVTYLGA